jgi:hypothetical protein
MEDPRFEVHQVWIDHRKIRRESIKVFENVPAYPISNLEDHFGNTNTILYACVDPRQLGFASARNRLWSLLLEDDKATWDCQLSFDQVLGVLKACPTMTAKDCA